jgi:hypothetical protein
VDPQEKFCRRFPLFVEAWGRGLKVISAIGYDAGDGDGRRLCKAFQAQEKYPSSRFQYWYPLVEWGWTRERCVEVIEQELLPVPPKSSCFFCGARKKPEIERLAAEHPELFWDAVAIEDKARLHSIKGLGTRFSWREFFETELKPRIYNPEDQPCRKSRSSRSPFGPTSGRPADPNTPSTP